MVGPWGIRLNESVQANSIPLYTYDASLQSWTKYLETFLYFCIVSSDHE